MAEVKSGNSSDLWTIDPISKAGRVSLYDTAGRNITPESAPTYSAVGSFTPPATPTDIVSIIGSASKIIRVFSFVLITNNTAAGSQQFTVIKRSTLNSGGTYVAVIGAAHDSLDAAATATTGHYTANPASLGASLGFVTVIRVASPVLVPGSFAGIVFDAGNELLPQIGGVVEPIVLQGAAQGLYVNFNSVALVAGQVHSYRITWTEEAQ